MKCIAAVLICAVSFLSAADGQVDRTVEISVAESLTVPANGVEVEILIKKEAETAADARKTAEILIRTILETLEKSGMKVLGSETGMVTAYPGFAPAPAQDKDLEATARLTVRLRYAGGLDPFAGPLAKLDPDLLIDGVSYFHTAEESLKSIMISRAAAAADLRKKAYEKSFRVSLVPGRITEIDDPGYLPPSGGINLEGQLTPAGTRDPDETAVPMVTRYLRLNVTYRITGK